MERPIKKSPRIEVVDALRGFAVMAILLVHNLEHFIFPVYPADAPGWLSVLDGGALVAVNSLFGGKAYAIFALLFGFTFYIQTNNQRKQGKDFGYRFLWRMVLLVGFATLNAAFFPAGDVLLLFVVVSPVLFITRAWSDKAVLVAAIVFLLQPIEWYQSIVPLFNPAYRLPDLKVEELYAQVAACTSAGSLGDFLLCNITLGQKASLLWAVGVGRFSQTAGLFLLGFYVGRKRLFVSSGQHLATWVRVLIVAAVSYVPLYAWKELAVVNDDTLFWHTIGIAFDMWQKLAYTGVLVASFVLLYQNEKFAKWAGVLRFYGKMSLTNYIAQSVIGAALYFPLGLYLAPYCGHTVSLLIAFFIFFLQILFCKWWLGRHKQGPLECIWHKWTWVGTDKA